MGNWRKVCTGLTVLFLILILFLNLFGSPTTAWYLERQVQQYLLDSGLTKEDILSTRTVYQKDKQTRYVVQVIFVEEPEIVHYYYSNLDKEIQEIDYVNQ